MVRWCENSFRFPIWMKSLLCCYEPRLSKVFGDDQLDQVVSVCVQQQKLNKGRSIIQQVIVCRYRLRLALASISTPLIVIPEMRLQLDQDTVPVVVLNVRWYIPPIALLIVSINHKCPKKKEAKVKLTTLYLIYRKTANTSRPRERASHPQQQDVTVWRHVSIR